MKLRNKRTGQEGNFIINKDHFECADLEYVPEYRSLAELNEDWEDYEPKEPLIKDEKIRRGIRAWWDMQDNPFKTARVLLISEDKDLDGFYHWTIFGYIRNGEEKMSTKLEFRTKKLYSYEPRHDYTKEELCGEWEDYKPKEPLIKDEKIRKAVRAWAESLRLQEVYCASNGYEIYGGIDEWVIQFEGEPFPFADKNKIYTIAELCGEEKE